MTEQDEQKLVGLRIVNARETLGITQTELADRIKMNRSVLNRIELGTRSVRDFELKAIANALDVTSDYLLGNHQTPADATQQEVDDLHRILDQGQLTYREEPVSKEAQDAVKALLEGYYWKKGRKRVKHDDNGDKE